MSSEPWRGAALPWRGAALHSAGTATSPLSLGAGLQQELAWPAQPQCKVLPGETSAV